MTITSNIPIFDKLPSEIFTVIEWFPMSSNYGLKVYVSVLKVMKLRKGVLVISILCPSLSLRVGNFNVSLSLT